MQKDQIIANVIMFIPVGVLAGWMWNWKGLGFGVGLSCAVEMLQLITSRGLCEFDDVMHNAVGTVIGVGIVVAGKVVMKYQKQEIQKEIMKTHRHGGA